MFSFFGKKKEPEPVCYFIEGYLGCSYFQQATKLASKLPSTAKVEVHSFNRKEWPSRRTELQKVVLKC